MFDDFDTMVQSDEFAQEWEDYMKFYYNSLDNEDYISTNKIEEQYK